MRSTFTFIFADNEKKCSSFDGRRTRSKTHVDMHAFPCICLVVIHILQEKLVYVIDMNLN